MSDAPIATVETIDGRRLLMCINEPARAHGLRCGQRLTDAQAILPGLTVADADPVGDQAGLEALADWCTRFAPATAIDHPEGLWLDVTGVAHLWGGEQALAEDLVDRLDVQGVLCRVAIADSFGAAWALLRYGPARERAVIIPPGRHRDRLQSLSFRALRLEDKIVTGLERLGLRRIGQLLALPRDQLARRFGEALTLRLDQAMGDAAEGLVFRQAPTPWFVRRQFAEPIAQAEDLARVLAVLAEDLCAHLARADQGGRRFVGAFHRVDGAVARVAIGLSVPGRDAARIALLLAQKLETVDPGFGIESATMTAEGVESLPPAQLDLPRHSASEKAQKSPLRPAANKNKSDDSVPQVDPAFLDMLGNRLGFDRLWRTTRRESYLPERAVARLSPVATEPCLSWPVGVARPIRLLRRPEPIEAMAPIPDDPPVQFRWRKILHRIARAEGPERIAFEWWRQAAPEDREETDLIRDYYRIEDGEGRRFWIYRAGLYTEQRSPRWYLHGFFA